MTESEIKALVQKQRAFFRSGKTLDVRFRQDCLKSLYRAIRDNLDGLHAALKEDLGKSASESYMCETGLTLSEISYVLRRVKKWSKPQRVKTPLAQSVSRSYRLPSPQGTVLVMSPWNYPFLLSLDPLVDAVAAGNTVVLKTSSSSPATSEAIKKLIESVFAPEHVAVVFGGAQTNDALFAAKYDYVFFTGSKRVGKEIYQKAAETLTPVTLELGGKSPCVVDRTANIPLAAKRIVWGKFLNLGQTCVAPDYILCQKEVEEELIGEIKKQIRLQFSEKPLENENYGKMISRKHFDRVRGLIEREKTAIGGGYDEATLKIEPTVLRGVTDSDPVMQEEIFGPVLPVMTYGTEEEALEYVLSREEPLALYIFSSDKKNIALFTERVGFGGGCVNDTVIHLATSEMPFGGFGASGTGAYHGKAGFDTFTHYKSIVDKKTFLDLPMRYQPFGKFYDKLIQLFLR